MKVKINDEIYDGEKESVMVILSDQDKKNIANMLPHCDRYCVYPTDKYKDEEILEWMDNV